MRLSVFVFYSLLCFVVAAYAFYYLFKVISPYDTIAIKFASSGLEIPAHFFGAGLSLLLVPFQLSQKLRSFTTFKAIIYATQGKIKLHKKWIYRSIALTSAAIIFRIYLGVGLGILQLPFLSVYLPISWLCWVLNLIVCEVIIYNRKVKINALPA